MSIKHSLITLASLIAFGFASAQTPAPAAPKAPEPNSTVSYNLGITSDYRYRGLSQSGLKPALQGGIMLISIVVIVVNLLVDLINGYLNPRVSHGQ